MVAGVVCGADSITDMDQQGGDGVAVRWSAGDRISVQFKPAAPALLKRVSVLDFPAARG